MTKNEVLDKLVKGQITVEQAAKLLPTETRAVLTVGRNKSGGLYVRHPKLIGFSVEKGKNYAATQNFPNGVGESCSSLYRQWG